MLKFIIGAALALAATPVAASDRTSEYLTARVQVHDLDLTAHSGRAALDRRLKVAVNDVCPDPQTPILSNMMNHSKCLRAARRSVANQREIVLARVARPSNPIQSGTQ